MSQSAVGNAFNFQLAQVFLPIAKQASFVKLDAWGK
jgi:hypothetical protein